MHPALPLLIALERELQGTPAQSRVAALLHPEFREFGYSGKQYDLAGALALFPPDGELAAAAPDIHSQDFCATELASGLIQLCYLSCHLAADGSSHRHARRSSLWQWHEDGWCMRFHQATPCPPFRS